MLDLINLSGLSVDVLLPVPSLPLDIGQRQTARGLVVQPGGVANALIMAARLGLRVGATGYLGGDGYGRQALRLLGAEGIDTAGVLTPDGTTSDTAIVMVDDAGRHTSVAVAGTAPGGLLVPDWRARAEPSRAVLVSGHVFAQSPRPDEMVFAVHALSSAGKTVCFDPGLVPADPDWLTALCQLSQVVMLTLDEAQRHLGVETEAQAARVLHTLGVELAVVKLGDAGCLAARRDEQARVPAPPVIARDTFAAADVFDAGVVYGYLEGWPLARLGRLANAVRAARLARLGTGSLLPTRAQVLEVLDKYK